MKRRTAVGLLGAAAAGSLDGGFFPARAAAQSKLQKVSLLSVPNDSSGEMYYARELGLWAKYGLDVDVKSANDPSATAAAVLSGNTTFGGLTTPGLAIAHERKIPIVIAAPTSMYSSAAPTSGLVVLKNSPIQKAADLNGKTIATRDISNLSYYGAKLWIDKNGGDTKTIKWYEVEDNLALAAMKAGRVDAASVSEPALDDALHGPDGRLLAACYDAIGKSFLIAAHYCTAEFAAQNPEIVQAFCDATIAAGIWANKHHAESGKILERYVGVPVASDSTRVTYAERVRPADAQPVLDALYLYGVIKAPLRAADLFAPQLHVEG